MSFQMKNCDNSKEIRVESPWRGQRITQRSTTKSQHREGVTFFRKDKKKVSKEIKSWEKVKREWDFSDFSNFLRAILNLLRILIKTLKQKFETLFTRHIISQFLPPESEANCIKKSHLTYSLPPCMAANFQILLQVDFSQI